MDSLATQSLTCVSDLILDWKENKHQTLGITAPHHDWPPSSVTALRKVEVLPAPLLEARGLPCVCVKVVELMRTPDFTTCAGRCVKIS